MEIKLDCIAFTKEVCESTHVVRSPGKWNSLFSCFFAHPEVHRHVEHHPRLGEEGEEQEEEPKSEKNIMSNNV